MIASTTDVQEALEMLDRYAFTAVLLAASILERQLRDAEHHASASKYLAEYQQDVDKYAPKSAAEIAREILNAQP